MFAKLMHGLTATLGRVKQLWTNVNVPNGVQTRHDFRDGQGKVPAIPVDNAGISNEAINVKAISYFGTDNAGISNEAINVKAISYPGKDNAGISNEVINVEEL